MAKKKIGIYGQLESTSNRKVEDLYIVVEDQSIHFCVKHTLLNKYVAFESFINNDANGWSPLLAYLQNNSKLMHAVYQQVHFVMNTPQVLITKNTDLKDPSVYENELNIIFGDQQDKEMLVQDLDEQKKIVFAVPDSLQTLLTRAFPIGKWNHYIQNIIQAPLSDGMHLYAFESYFIVFVLAGQQLQFVHYFSEQSAAQNNYQVLNICKQLSIPPAQTTIYINGYSHNEHAWIEELVQYFINAVVVDAPSNGVAADLNQAYPNHSFAPYFIF